VDRPLVAYKTAGGNVGAVVVPHMNWRGLFSLGTSESGAASTVPVEWPGFRTTAYHSRGETQESTKNWMGSLLEGQRDAGGQMYMRNRYYDPKTGQFTQTDPIGIAGGLNTYGFAAGDPVSYTDPYGLCSPWPQCWLTRLRGASSRGQAALESAAAEQMAQGGMHRIVGVSLTIASTAVQAGIRGHGSQVHHIATDKNNVLAQQGGPWTPKFQALFAGAGMSLNDPENLVSIAGHQGPHSEQYHRVVFDRLFSATEGFAGDEYKAALVGELRQMRTELMTPGSDLNKLVTTGN
jgi:RHS repeat-associated protein